MVLRAQQRSACGRGGFAPLRGQGRAQRGRLAVAHSTKQPKVICIGEALFGALSRTRSVWLLCAFACCAIRWSRQRHFAHIARSVVRGLTFQAHTLTIYTVVQLVLPVSQSFCRLSLLWHTCEFTSSHHQQQQCCSMTPHAEMTDQHSMPTDMLANDKGVPKAEVKSWSGYPGGAPCNVACGLGQLDIPVAFVSNLGNDDKGTELYKLMNGVCFYHTHSAFRTRLCAPSARARMLWLCPAPCTSCCAPDTFHSARHKCDQLV